ncbi:hypothetical protein THOM_2750 [Trachipleistophora hominis]|uniref:Uncharacterized protein n=1 Tax=Trachipleistophora hominis TaxID=72359 RepID=L7JU89_TRAHO|nr:hypothetical protein THOM_2750 [Trachipleistophora hominis]
MMNAVTRLYKYVDIDNKTICKLVHLNILCDKKGRFTGPIDI